MTFPSLALQIETWDVSKQRPGPNWKLAQFLTYWHARQAHVANQGAPEDGKQPSIAAGMPLRCAVVCLPALYHSACAVIGALCVHCAALAR